MHTTRRDVLKFGALATAAAALPSLASASGVPAPVGKAAKLLNIPISSTAASSGDG